MKTKTLLIAAAVLAAGVMSSQAQVYSQNVVGYVNVTPAAGVFTMECNPLDNGAGNVLSNLFANIPGGSTLQVWNGSGYDGYKFQAGHWKNLSTLANADNLSIPPGAGFFITPGSAYTNTFVGSLVAASGASVTNGVAPGLQCVGSLLPYAGAVTNSATFNLTVAGGTTLQKWDPNSQSFIGYKFQAGHWVNLNTSASEVPQIGVAEGFFLSPSTTSNIWVETLQ